MNCYKIFVVEDDAWYGEVLEYHLSLNPDYEVHRFTTGKECLAHLHLKPDLVTIDYSLPDYKGDKLFQKIGEQNAGVPVIIISGQEDITTAVELLKMGVQDYIVKNEHTKEVLWNAIIRIRETSKLKQQVEFLKEELGQKLVFDKSIKGQSPAIRKVFHLMEKATRSHINVSIFGETGTGKELVAKAIHYNSDRKTHSFVAVNMAAIPRELIESELFGYEKGAFTNALTRKIGKFEEAMGGTIFLDEIAELDLSVQSKILRVLQEREVVRVGGQEKIKLDIRLIVATHKNLADEVRRGRFREDLYYRVIGMPLELPPLRDRCNDILVLAKHFIEEASRENKLPPLALSQEAKNKLLLYNYPGNIRELKAVIELAVVMSDGKELQADDITFSSIRKADAFLASEKTLRQYTCDIVQQFLKKYDSDIALVAEKLDIGKSTLYKMIKEGEVDAG